MKEKVSIIIPFLNEEESIPLLFNSLSMFVSNYVEAPVEIIFVDDGSSDQSVALLTSYKSKRFNAKVIKLSKNFGSHAALRAGVLHATGDYICFVYADLQDPLEIILEMKSKCESGYEIVFAERKSLEGKYFDLLFSRLYAFLMKKLVSPKFPDNGFDTVMFGKKIQSLLNQNIESNSSIFLQILISGFHSTSISYEKKERKLGKSKWTLSKKIKLFIDSFVAFSFFPIQFVSVIGILFFLIGLIWTTYIILRHLLFNDLILGWPALISILLTGFGITNISLGIIAEYLWRTLDISRKRPVFIIDEIYTLK